jgi:hypothetical protein
LKQNALPCVFDSSPAALHKPVSGLLTPYSMISPKKSLLSLLLLGFIALTAGCMSAPRDSSIPWSRPATWEGQIPGMSGTAVTR